MTFAIKHFLTQSYALWLGTTLATFPPHSDGLELPLHYYKNATSVNTVIYEQQKGP